MSCLLLCLALNGCMRLPESVAAEFDCAPAGQPDNFGNQRCVPQASVESH
jgi:hypothetical protein